MRSALLSFIGLLSLTAGLSARPAPAAEPNENAAEAAAIKKNVAAFDKGDARAVAAFWTADGDYVLAHGRQNAWRVGWQSASAR